VIVNVFGATIFDDTLGAGIGHKLNRECPATFH